MSSFGGTLDLIFLCEIQILHAHVGFLKGFAELWWGIANSSLVLHKAHDNPLVTLDSGINVGVRLLIFENF